MECVRINSRRSMDTTRTKVSQVEVTYACGSSVGVLYERIVRKSDIG